MMRITAYWHGENPLSIPHRLEHLELEGIVLEEVGGGEE